MILFHILLIQTIFHFLAFVFSLFSVIRRWGYYWLLPASAALLFMLDSIQSAVDASTEVILLDGRELLVSMIPLAGALLWFVSLLVVHKAVLTRKNEQFSRKIFLEENSADPVLASSLQHIPEDVSSAYHEAPGKNPSGMSNDE